MGSNRFVKAASLWLRVHCSKLPSHILLVLSLLSSCLGRRVSVGLSYEVCHVTNIMEPSYVLTGEMPSEHRAARAFPGCAYHRGPVVWRPS